MLGVDVSVIKKTGELCDKYNDSKENCTVIVEEKQLTIK